MGIELLRTFPEVSRTRHFGQAAEAMALTQAAVSAGIKSLEHLLGVRLFIRNKRDIWVEDAPLIEHRVNAVFPVPSGRKLLIDDILSFF